MRKNKLKEFFSDRKKNYILAGGVAALLIVIIIILCVVSSYNDSSESTVYKETEVYYGDLTVGISEDSTVDIGTVEQTFDLDISSLVSTSSSSDSSSTQSGSQGMGSSGSSDMFSQLFNLASSTSQTTTSENTMDIESVEVTVGQRVEVGDILYTLTQESVDAIRTELAEDVETAETDLEELETEQKSTKLSAEQTYESSIAYGQYAQTEYDNTISDLQDAVEDKSDELDLATEQLALYQSQLTELQEQYTEAVATLDAATYSAENTDKLDSTYWYLQYENTREKAESYAENLETEIENLEDSIETTTDSISQLETDLAKAKRELASGVITAKEQYDLRMLAYNNADETLDVATSYLEENLAAAQETYDDAVEKLDEFDSYIVDNAVLAEYSGLVTDVALASGDTVSMDTVMVTLYDDDDVTMTATVSEDDIENVALDDTVNITLTAFEDEIFQGLVTEISDATYNSSTGENEYSVTVTIQGDVEGLYQGMTGEVTFITKESQEVLYVSNRAIVRDGTTSYVKVKDENGNIVNKEVVTGFSDGVNVEIVEGLSEGDIVLIESKVSE